MGGRINREETAEEDRGITLNVLFTKNIIFIWLVLIVCLNVRDMGNCVRTSACLCLRMKVSACFVTSISLARNPSDVKANAVQYAKG